MNRLFIIGARSHAREIHEAVLGMVATGKADWTFGGFIKDGLAHNDLIAQRGERIVGDVADFERMDPAATTYVIGAGSPSDRKRLDERLSGSGFEAATIVHPSANVGHHVALGPGCYVAMGANITTQVELGRHVHVNTGAVVSHDSRIGDYAIINPGALLAGGSIIQEGAYIGIGAIVFGERTVGAWATVGAGAVVTKGVRSNATVVGNPARPVPERLL